MKRKYFTLDVFTDRALAGNPLAVVLDSDGLDDQLMQAIAGEFNLSETVFVGPPVEAERGAAIRIFTPAHELPFAGHPTVGTAILLNHLNHLGCEDEFILEEQVGPVKCVVKTENGSKVARFGLPRISKQIDHEIDIAVLATALGIDQDHIVSEDVSIWDGGVPYTMVPVRSIDAVRNIKINTVALEKVEPIFDGIAANPYVFCAGGETADAQYHARMFAPLFGIPEDPATGSAVASFSGYLASSVLENSDSRTFKIEQGYEMGRPSQIFLDIKKHDGQVVDAGISGGAVIISEGYISI